LQFFIIQWEGGGGGGVEEEEEERNEISNTDINKPVFSRIIAFNICKAVIESVAND
jgi:hypothetical protein